MRNIVVLVLALAIMAIIIIGLTNFNLMIDLWVELLVGVLCVGVLVALIKAVFRSK